MFNFRLIGRIIQYYLPAKLNYTMAHQIKYRFLHSLFRLFTYLSDRSGGWWVFVKPKLIFGVLLLGAGMTALATQPKKRAKPKLSSQTIDSVKPVTATQLSPPMPYCYEPAMKPMSEEADTTVYTVVKKMPQFPGGDVSAYLAQNIHYPATAMCYETGSGPQGRVICQFVVEKDGSITNVRVVRSVDPGLDKEAIRVISSMPKWIPGEQNGKKVRVQYLLPLNIDFQ
jgi:TonB family protein